MVFESRIALCGGQGHLDGRQDRALRAISLILLGRSNALKRVSLAFAVVVSDTLRKGADVVQELAVQ